MFFPRLNLGAGKIVSVSGVMTVNAIISYEIITKIEGS